MAFAPFAAFAPQLASDVYHALISAFGEISAFRNVIALIALIVKIFLAKRTNLCYTTSTRIEVI